MQIFTNTKVDFMRLRPAAMVFSAILIIVSIVSFAVRGLNLGIDFTGGTIIEVSYPNAIDLGSVRKALKSAGFEDAVVQHFGTASDVMIRLAPRKGLDSAELGEKVKTALQTTDPKVELKRQEFVGPQVGQDLTSDGSLAVLYTLIGVLIYVALRFKFQFAVGSILALIHDPILTIGFFSLTQMEFNLTVLAAVLAVIGYSLNDTIVVFDRIRENFRRLRKAETEEVINVSINQTLSRTVLTSGTTLFVVLALFVFGGELIHGFATALLIGIVVGTYSSIYIASPVLIFLGVTRGDLLPVKKEGEEFGGV